MNATRDIARKTELDTIRFQPTLPFHPGWSKVRGIRVGGDLIEIEPDIYFERLESVEWQYVPWELVRQSFDILVESPAVTLEQRCLEFVRRHVVHTTDPLVVLENAEKVFTYLYDRKHIDGFAGLDFVTDLDLRVLRESSILSALNQVDMEGHITNIGPAWYFAQCATLVYDLSIQDENRVDELFHGGFFNGPRLRDQLRAHCALAGRLVHGCGSGNGSHLGGCVVAFGTNVEAMQLELMELCPRVCATMGS